MAQVSRDSLLFSPPPSAAFPGIPVFVVVPASNPGAVMSAHRSREGAEAEALRLLLGKEWRMADRAVLDEVGAEVGLVAREGEELREFVSRHRGLLTPPQVSRVVECFSRDPRHGYHVGETVLRE